MEKEKLESLLIDYIDGRLSKSEAELVEKKLEESEQARLLLAQLKQVFRAIDQSQELTPGSAMKQQFQALLQQEIAKGGTPPAARQLFFRPVIFRAAAAIALVMVGVSIGYWINKNQQRENELAAIRMEMEATKKVMMAMLANQQSASQRLVGVSVAYKMVKADDDIVTALVKTMNEDGNTNVRLAALEALGKFQQLPHVRQWLIKSLTTQTDPVVQIELIRLLVDMKEKEVVNELERITNDESMLPAVKDEAHAGIMKLS